MTSHRFHRGHWKLKQNKEHMARHCLLDPRPVLQAAKPKVNVKHGVIRSILIQLVIVRIYCGSLRARFQIEFDYAAVVERAGR